jgi:hypothetical protein
MEENNRESFEDIDGLGFVLSAICGAGVMGVLGAEAGASMIGRLSLGALMGAGVYMFMPVVRLLGKGVDAVFEAIDRKLDGKQKQRSRYRETTRDSEKSVARKNTIPKKVQRQYDTDPNFRKYIEVRQKEEYERWEKRGKSGFFGPTPLNPLAEYRKYKKIQEVDKRAAKITAAERKRWDRVMNKR